MMCFTGYDMRGKKLSKAKKKNQEKIDDDYNWRTWVAVIS